MSSTYEFLEIGKCCHYFTVGATLFTFSETPYYEDVLSMTGTFSVRQFHNIFSFEKDFVVAVDA